MAVDTPSKSAAIAAAMAALMCECFSSASGVVTLTHLNIISGTDIYGGGIVNDGTLTLQNSTLSGNSAHEGGGIYNAWYADHPEQHPFRQLGLSHTAAAL